MDDDGAATIVAVVLAAGGGSRFGGGGHKLLADDRGVPVIRRSVESAVAAAIGPVVVVAGAVELADALSGLDVDLVGNEDWRDGQSSSLRTGVRAAEQLGAAAVVVGLGDMPDVGADAWRAVAGATGDLVSASYDGHRSPPVRIAASLWDALPTDGDEGARALMRLQPDLVSVVEVSGSGRDVDRAVDLDPVAPSDDDEEAVQRLLGRRPLADFDVVVRRGDGTPMVIRNAPLLPDGRPMPTRYWLVDPDLNREIGRLESAGGVDRAEREVDADELEAAHRRYAAERDAAIPVGHDGPRPSGGVGGTRTGVKCLHTHYANFLATGDDPVGRWVADRLPRRPDSASFMPRPDPEEPSGD